MTAADYFCTKCSALMDMATRCGDCHLCPKCCKCYDLEICQTHSDHDWNLEVIPGRCTKCGANYLEENPAWNKYYKNHSDDDHEEFVSDIQEEPNDTEESHI